MSTESRDPSTELDSGDFARRAGSAELELIRYLRRSRDQFAAIFHGVSEGIMVRNNTGGLVYLNNAASGLLGCSSHQEVLDGPAQEPTLDRVQVLDEKGQPFPCQQLPWRITLQGAAGACAVLRFRDVQTGAERVAIVRSAPIFDERGRVELEVTTMTDITERKRAEEEAEARGRLLEALFETSPVGIFMVDAGENILYVNSELARICGRPAEPGGRAQDFWKGMVFYRRDGAPYKANELPLQRALGEQEKVLAQEVFLHREDGSIVPTLVNATPTYSATGQVT
jgi:PAS domain-containing protein